MDKKIEDERENCRRGREKQVIRAEKSLGKWGVVQIASVDSADTPGCRCCSLPSGGGGGES